MKKEKERMEPFGIRIGAELRENIHKDAATRKPQLTPSDVSREILEAHYSNKKGKKK